MPPSSAGVQADGMCSSHLKFFDAIGVQRLLSLTNFEAARWDDAMAFPCHRSSTRRSEQLGAFLMLRNF